MIVLTNQPIRKYYITIVALVLPVVIILPILIEYFERIIGRVISPIQNPKVDALALIVVATLTGLNIRVLYQLIKKHQISLIVPWAAIALSLITVVIMISTGQ